ncbi:MAG: thioredoxin-dependent thiol peroxidase [Candidatus Acidiferrales bacterium]
MLQEGEKAPDFSVLADDGKTVSLGDYRGKNLILYFYPKANTPGCIHEANGFRNMIADFQAQNAAIAGVSGDNVEAQSKFSKKLNLNFPLLADTEFQIIETYGARRMKSFLGKTFLGIVRTTFWIGPDGKINKIWNNVTPRGHAAEVLAALRGE